MKQLLLLFIAFGFSFYSLSAQAPPNELIQNATLVNASPFVETNVRILEATPNSGGQNGCNLTGFRLVYYKFTAQENNDISITIENAYTGASISDTFAIIYTAPSLNATSNSELTLASNCVYTPIIDNKARNIITARFKVFSFNVVKSLAPKTIPNVIGITINALKNNSELEYKPPLFTLTKNCSTTNTEAIKIISAAKKYNTKVARICAILILIEDKKVATGRPPIPAAPLQPPAIAPIVKKDDIPTFP